MTDNPFTMDWYLDAVRDLQLHARLVGWERRPGFKINPRATAMKVRRWAGGCLVEIPRDLTQLDAAFWMAKGFVDAQDVRPVAPSYPVAIEDAMVMLMPGKWDPFACAPVRQLLGPAQVA